MDVQFAHIAMASRRIYRPWDRPRPLTGIHWGHAVYTVSGVADKTEISYLTTGAKSKTYSVYTCAFYLGSSAPTSLPASLTTYHFSGTQYDINSPTGYAGDYTLTKGTGFTFPAASRFAANNRPITSLSFSGSNRLSHIRSKQFATRTHLVQPSGYASAPIDIGYILNKTASAASNTRHVRAPGANAAAYSYYFAQPGRKLAAPSQRLPTSQTTFTATLYANQFRNYHTQIWQPATQWVAVRTHKWYSVIGSDLWRGEYRSSTSATDAQYLIGRPGFPDFLTDILWPNSATVYWEPS